MRGEHPMPVGPGAPTLGGTEKEPTMFKRTTFFLSLALTLGLVGVASAAPAAGNATVVIRHQTHGCHSWSVDGGAFKASQSITLHRGATLTVTNTDIMPHTLVLTSGPAARIAHAKLAHMDASVKVTLTKPGTYRFTTKPGEDYMSGVKTIGADNVLRLTIVVT
jgi:plastocyanin